MSPLDHALQENFEAGRTLLGLGVSMGARLDFGMEVDPLDPADCKPDLDFPCATEGIGARSIFLPFLRHRNFDSNRILVRDSLNVSFIVRFSFEIQLAWRTWIGLRTMAIGDHIAMLSSL